MLVEAAGSKVIGELVWVDKGHCTVVLRHMDFLERFDGQNLSDSVFLRVRRTALAIGKPRVRAWVCIGRLQMVQALPEIASSDWRAHTANPDGRLRAWEEMMKVAAD